MVKRSVAQVCDTENPALAALPSHILVVDDSRFMRTFLHDGLSGAGYRVTCAENGKKALEVLNAERVDMVISDIHMPVMDGKAFRAQMLLTPENSAIPFLIMSTDDSEENVKVMRELRVSAFLSKPFKADQAIILVERILDYTSLLINAHQEMANQEKVMILSSIMSLAQTLDARDAYTRSHSDSVAETAVHIVRHLRGDASQVEMMHIAGRLHDIGKVGIPDSILQKPGRLTTEEYDVIKTHPGIGARILEPIPSLFEVAGIIHTHHEKFDGSGYPRGIAGENIPFLARVLALADAYDALTSDRPYRKGMEKEQALAIIKSGRSSHFCPTCLDAFLASI